MPVAVLVIAALVIAALAAIISMAAPRIVPTVGVTPILSTIPAPRLIVLSAILVVLSAILVAILVIVMVT